MRDKRVGFSLIGVLVGITIILIVSNIGYIYFRNARERQEIKTAKVKICQTIQTYSSLAFKNQKEYYLIFDYNTKNIIIKNRETNIKINLPKRLEYVSIFDKKAISGRNAKITKNGNITPSFSIYIFGYDHIARYRISFFGFDIIKYMRINVYKNMGDKSATYQNISNFHKRWKYKKVKWREI